MSGMAGTGFIRVKLLQVDLAESTDESFLAVNVKEMVDIPGGAMVIVKMMSLGIPWDTQSAMFNVVVFIVGPGKAYLT